MFLLVVVLSAGVLGSSEAQKDFRDLPESYRRGAELALQQVNSHKNVQNHFLFFKSLLKSDIDVSQKCFSLLYFILVLVLNSVILCPKPCPQV